MSGGGPGPGPGQAAAARRPIRTLFVANRGEIAARIATTARRLGIVAVVPAVGATGHGDGATEQSLTAGPDRPPGNGRTASAAEDPGDAPGERRAAGGGSIRILSLLDPDEIVRAALATGADAVHPGYGFLAESPLLAAAVGAAGLTWVGPPPDAIRTLGDKARAREVARGEDVPVAAGEEPGNQSDASLMAAAGRIGLPLLVKPAAGGGGKGIRIVRAAGELAPAIESARREAARAFGDDRLILERFVSPARHVEVQVLADIQGDVVHLGDRDCSLQRRHQKVLEEAPAPGLVPALRTEIRQAAIRVTRAVGYRGAGTVEFLVDDDGRWVFLEMNARLQVEHPVTEAILGRDLVADQLGIAEGAALTRLGLRQEAIDAALAAGGHAVEVRLNAEDPAAGFLPSAGTVSAVRWPDGARAFEPSGPGGIRVDSGIERGDVVGGAFDPLLAKLIAHGRDRAAALEGLAAALDATEVLGLVTNLAFLRRLVRLEAVRAGRARTGTLESLPGEVTAAAPIPTDAWERAAAALASGDPGGEPRDGWRLNTPARLHLVADGPSGEEDHWVAPSPRSGGADRWVAAEDEAGVGHGADAAAQPPEPLLVRDGEAVHLSIDGRSVAFRLAPPPSLERAASAGRGAGAGSATDLVAPMPGTVLAVHVAVGGSVEAGTPVVTLEAMKMEHVVSAPRPGRVAELLVAIGDRVDRGRLVARLEADPADAMTGERA
jgi:acetyl/propionyl-CoA carboxylase alpha subunit